MNYHPPTAVHHFSPPTRVSLELPPGWVEADSGERYTIYALAPSEAAGLTVPPKFIVEVVDRMLLDPEAYLEMARRMLGLPKAELEIHAHETTVVDGFDGVADLYDYREASVKHLVSQYQVFVQVGQVVFSLNGIVGAEHRDDYLPIFRAAVESIRFVQTEPEVQS